MSSSSTMRQFTPTPKELMPRLEIQALFDDALAKCYPDLKGISIFQSLKGKAREEYGDYAFLGVLEICKRLIKDKPHLFDDTKPNHIAEEIKTKFESLKSDDDKSSYMVKELFLQKADASILTFKLEGRWIAERINRMLNVGMSTWAPTIFGMESGERFVFAFPANTMPITVDMNADMVRAVYMKEALVDMYIYSGVDAVSGSYDTLALIMARNKFTEKQGKIVCVEHETSLFTLNGSCDNVYTDLATLWHGINTQKARMMVYMTPHPQRGYIRQCHIAAATVGWLPDNWEDICMLTCCGFQTMSVEQNDMSLMWSKFRDWSQGPLRLQNLWHEAGYSCSAFFECAFKFTCLKKTRLAECIFTFEDIVDNKGNTFISLLETQALASSLTKNSPDKNLFKLNELVGKERELGLHLVEFTGVIETACGTFMPEIVCEYMCNLSKLFMCYHREEFRNDENMLGLCKATEVVMNKCFDLLGIASSLGELSDVFKSYVYRKEAALFGQVKEVRASYYHMIPLSEDARRYVMWNEYLKSRFELISMSVRVTAAHSSFVKGNISGRVLVVDTCRLAKGWPVFDAKDDGYVCCFDHEWYDPVCILNGSYVPFGNPSSLHSIPFSSSIAVHVRIKATSENNNEAYLLCNRGGSSDLSEFWRGDSNTKFGTIKFHGDYGRIQMYYVALKDAIDTKMELTFHSRGYRKAVRLSGYISASYGDEVISNCGFLGQYKAVVFRANPTENIAKKNPLTLHKSTLAVPANSYFMIEACLRDADTQKLIVDGTKKFSVDGVNYWDIKFKKGSFFKFKVNWVR